MGRTTTQIRRNLGAMQALTGLSLSGIGRLAGFSQSAISKKYNGTSAWTSDDLDTLADALHLEVAELVGTLPSTDEWLARKSRAAGSLVAAGRAGGDGGI